MSKYDFEIDLSMNSSTGMILSKLRPHSVVLEFGCATGRMTRYMKEALQCQVYIVEYEESAFQKAREFAVDGICDDIQTYRWLERFGGISFDAIIFADVLEHLRNPEEVLGKAAGLLKPDGSIYVSVPNMTHNDVVLKAIEEHFDYTETGLLDNTHIHFWGLENIRTLGKAAGLRVRSLEGTHCPMGSTEQNAQTGKNPLLENILRERSAGEIYQFVLALDNQDSAESICTIEAPVIYSHIYLDTGNDFNVQERITVNAGYSGHGSYLVHYEFAARETVRRVRLDPIEGQGVVLHSISVCQNGKELNLMIPNAVEVDTQTYIHSEDPMVIAQLQPGAGMITVDAEFVLPGTQYLGALENAIWAEKQAMEQNQRQMHALQGRLNELMHEKAALNACLDAKEKQVLQLNQRNRELETDVCAYVILVNQKEKLILSLEQKAQRYDNLLRVRIQRFIVRMLRKTKKCIKKLLRRG